MIVKEVIGFSIYVRGYKPRLGVALSDKPLLADPKHRHGGDQPSEDPQGLVFSVQYGLRTVYWAAGSSHEAKASFSPGEAPVK
jgi:hypothetical protein